MNVARLVLRTGVGPSEWLAHPELLDHALAELHAEDQRQRRETMLAKLNRKLGR